MKLVIVISALMLSACGARCVQTPYAETLVFQNAGGMALGVLRLEDLETGLRYECTQAGVDANPGSELGDCQGNRIVISRRSPGAHIVRAEAVTGGKFAGSVSPEQIPPTEAKECAQTTLAEVVLVLK